VNFEGKNPKKSPWLEIAKGIFLTNPSHKEMNIKFTIEVCASLYY
jgi:hypothetical protein